jgi:hypothetical protein
VFDLDKKTAKLIQFKIDKWHNNYIDWCFYRNANRFFVEHQELPKDELVTLKMEFDEVFDASGELLKLVTEIGKNHEKINIEYASSGEPITKDILTPVVHQYITFFKVIYEDIKKHMPDTLDFIRERQQDLGYEYRFDENIKTALFKSYSDIKNILDSFGDNITKYPYLKLVSLFQIFTKQIDALNRQNFPQKLKEAFDLSIAQNGRSGQRNFYKTYTLIQYVYWLLFDTSGSSLIRKDNPFEDNYDDYLPNILIDQFKIPKTEYLGPDLKYNDDFSDYKRSKDLLDKPQHFDDREDIFVAEGLVKRVESERKHVRRLIEIYKQDVSDEDLKKFIVKYMSFDNKTIRSYEDTKDKNTQDLPFGIDLLFYVLYFTTNKVVTFIKANKNFFDKIDDKNGELQIIRQEIQLKESKLTHIIDLISKLVGIPVERIIPDRVSYFQANTGINAGLIDPANYIDAWADKISLTPPSGSNPTDVSKKVRYVTKEMNKGLNKALGMVDDSSLSDDDKKKDNDKKMKTHLLSLLEHNTVQVVHMLFAKPRDIWYSPDLRLGEFSASPKWSFFRLEKPEIISNTAFKNFRKILDDTVPSGGSHQRLDYILNKSLRLPVASVAHGSSPAPPPPE